MQGRRRPQEDESGFTLIEVLISIVVLGFIASGVAASIILFFTTTDATSSRLALSHDSQLLATYLIPDLDNLTGATAAVPPPMDTAGVRQASMTSSGPGQPSVTFGPGMCATGVSFSDLRIQYTDLNSQHTYLADYSVSAPMITRTFWRDGSIQAVTTVVHNLKSGGYACFSGAAPWTMTVTTESPNDPTTDYAFSVTGGGRVTTPSPVGAVGLGEPSAAPVLCDPAKCDSPVLAISTNNNGLIEEIVVTFDQPLNVNDAEGTSQWMLSELPQGVSLQSVRIVGNQAILVPTSPFTMTSVGVTFNTKPDGVRNAANQPAPSFGQATPIPAANGVSPTLTSIVSQDTNGDGKVNQVVATFSQPLAPTTTTTQWKLSGQPPGVTLNSVTVSGAKATLVLNQGTTIDTIASGFKVALSLDPTGIRNTDGYPSSFPATAVSDGMAPVPIPNGIVSKDTNHDGKVNQIAVSFSESLVTSTNLGPWSISGQPAGVTINSVSVAGNTATLTLNEGTTFDTAATGLQVSLAADPAGVRSATTGNVSSFGSTTALDGMSPVVIDISSSNVNGGTPGKMESGDTLTLTFSEPLAASSLPARPTITLTPGTATSNDKLSIPGLATIDLSTQNAYVTQSSVTFNATVSIAANAITVTVAGGGGGNVQIATAASTMKVTPSNMVTDLATPANTAAGTLTSSGPTILF